MTVLVWILTLTVGWLLVTGIAGRLLGARRGWVALTLAGVGGLAGAVVAGGEPVLVVKIEAVGLGVLEAQSGR